MINHSTNHWYLANASTKFVNTYVQSSKCLVNTSMLTGCLSKINYTSPTIAGRSSKNQYYLSSKQYTLPSQAPRSSILAHQLPSQGIFCHCVSISCHRRHIGHHLSKVAHHRTYFFAITSYSLAINQRYLAINLRLHVIPSRYHVIVSPLFVVFLIDDCYLKFVKQIIITK